MTPFQFTLVAFGISLVAGLLGSLLGLGGGIIVVPALTLLLKIDIRYAIGASIVSVIATSSGAAAAYVRERMTNLRVAMLLEVATTTGALTGAFLAGVIGGRWLYVIFGLIMGYSALAMLHNRDDHAHENVPADALADRLNLHGSYFDESLGREVAYRVTHVRLGLLLMYVAGIVSGLLGIGSGALKVPAMDLAMRLPIKVSTATSNFMIGVTAAASAGVYFARGDIDPFVAAPVAAGVLIGATGGSLLLGKLKNKLIRIVFIVVLLGIALQMLVKRNSAMIKSGGPNQPVSEADLARVHKVEIVISNILRFGVVLSLAIIVTGTVMGFVHHPQYFNSPAELEPLTKPTGAVFPETIRGVIDGVRDGQGRAIVVVGLLVLIATPVVRVAVSVLAFVYQRDRTFVVLTLVVLGLLLLSFYLGTVEG